jgi:hypothetical protein
MLSSTVPPFVIISSSSLFSSFQSYTPEFSYVDPRMDMDASSSPRQCVDRIVLLDGSDTGRGGGMDRLSPRSRHSALDVAFHLERRAGDTGK